MKAKVKKNVFLLIIEIFCLLGTVLMLTNGSIAYFFDTENADATLTAGNVDIELTEAAIKQDPASGNLVADPDKPRVKGSEMGASRNYGTIYPGMSIHKDPVITNVGSDAAWVAARVTFHDGAGNLLNIMGYEGFHAIDIEVLLGGALLDEDVTVGTWNNYPNVCYNDRYAMVQIVDPTAEEFEFFFFILDKMEPGESVQIFESMNIPPEWTSTEMKELVNLNIRVQALGVQTFSFETCYDAMIAAFPQLFSNNT